MSSQYAVSIDLKVQQAFERLKQLTQQFGKVDDAVKKAQEAANRWSTDLQRQGSTIKNTNAAIDAHLGRLRKIRDNLEINSQKYRAVTAEIQKFERAQAKGRSGGGGAIGAIASSGAALAGGAALGQIGNIGKQISDAEGAVRTLAGSTFPEMQRAIAQTVQQSGGLTNELDAMRSAYDLLSAGVTKASDVQKVMGAAINLSRAGFTSNETAIDGLTTILNAYGLSADKAGKVTDMLVQTQNDGKIIVDQYAASIGTLAPLAANLGISLEEVNAAIAQGTATGVKPEVQITAIKSALAKLAAPTKEMTDILSAYGLKIDATTLKQDGLIKTIEKLSKLGKVDLVKVIGTEAGQGLLPLLNDIPKLIEFTKRQREADGVAAEAVKERAKGYEALTTAINNAATQIQIEVFRGLAPIFEAIAQGVLAALQAFLALPKPIKTALGLLIGVSAAALAAAGAIAGIGIGIAALGGMQAILAGIATGFSLVGTSAAAAWAFVTGPIGLTIAAIVGVGLAIKALYDKWEPFRNAVDATGRFIQGFFKGFIDGATDGGRSFERMWKKITDGAMAVVGVIKGVAKGIGEFFQGAAALISKAWTGTIDTLIGLGERFGINVRGVFKAIADFWATVVKFIQDKWAKAVETIINLTPVGMLSQLVGINIGKGVTSGIESGLKAVQAPSDLFNWGAQPGAKQSGGILPPLGPDLANLYNPDKDGKGKSEAEKAAEKAAKEKAELDKQNAQNAIALDNRVFANRMELIRQAYELERQLQDKTKNNWALRFTGAGREQAQLINELTGNLQGYQDKIVELQNKIKEAEQAVKAAKAGVGVAGIGASGGAAGGPLIGGFSSSQISAATSEASKFTGIANMCAESVKAFYKSLGISLPGVTAWADTVRNAGTVMRDWSQLKPGDIVATGQPGDTPHVGVYTGGNNVFHQSRSRGLKAGNYPDLNYFQQGGYFVRPGAQAQMGGGAGSNAAGIAGAMGDVATAEAELKGLNEQLALLQSSIGKLTEADLTGFVLKSADAFNQETASLEKQTAALQLRNQLELEGAKPETIEGRLKMLEVDQKLEEQTKALDDALKENIISEKYHAIALDAVTEAANRTKSAIEKYTKAASAKPGKITQYMNQLKEDLGDSEGRIVSLAQTIESELGSAMSNAITGVIDGTSTVEEAFSTMFKNIGKAFIDMATQMLAQQIVLTILKMLNPGPSAIVPGVDVPVSQMPAGMAFAGGGYTGNAPRAGGVDGQGGFPAILHPGETVTDHRASSARQALNNGGGGGGGGGQAMVLNVTATRIADDNWVKVGDLDAAMAKAAKQGAAMGTKQTLDRLRQSPQTRRGIGI